MTDMGLRTRKFDPTQASSDEFAAMNVFENQQLEESWPDDPPDAVRVLDVGAFSR